MNIAVVTGASSGLGREFAHLLDTDGLDEIWVTARRADRLAALQDSLQTPVRVFAGDISQAVTTAAIQRALEEQAPRVRYLICSAGFGKIGTSDSISLAAAQKMIEVNCTAAVTMTYLCLPFMT
ncbi:SDR family NAD(P)-dependent oxidoreductase, partial [Megasphaera cerevisiae]